MWGSEAGKEKSHKEVVFELSLERRLNYPDLCGLRKIFLSEGNRI